MFLFEKRGHSHPKTENDETAKSASEEKKMMPDIQEPVSLQPTAETFEKSKQAEDFLLPEMQGNMLALWRRWAGDQLPPILSLTGKMEPEKLPLDESELEREKVRLTAKLCQDAQSRVEMLQNLERTGAELKSGAKCCCYVSENQMIAWLFIFPPVGSGEKLTSEKIGSALEAGSVKNGIEVKTVVAVLKDTPYFELIPIAIGTPPVEGRDGVVHEKFPHQLKQEILVDENGNADYRSISYIQNVDKGQVLCDIEPPCPGQDGLGVDGKPAPAKAVSPAKVPQGRNTALSDDGLHLIALQSGNLEYKNDVFHVRAVLEIEKDVDYSTGNIDFIGDVHIHGDVRENFTVQAKGTIMIDGLVEASQIIAGGDLLISSGVVGDSRAVLKSAGNVRAKYLESCQVYSGRSVYADCIMSSQICCDDSIIVTSGRGSIIGGSLTAGKAVRAKMIGARSGRQTEIILGELPYAQLELESLNQEIEQAENEKTSVERAIADMERCAIRGERKAKAKIRKVTLEVKLEKLKKNKNKITEQKPDLTQCLVDCDVIYPITKIIMGKDAEYVDGIQNRYRMKYDDLIAKHHKTRTND